MRQTEIDNAIIEAGVLGSAAGAEGRRAAMEQWISSHPDILATQQQWSAEIDQMYQSGTSTDAETSRFDKSFESPSSDWADSAAGIAKVIDVNLQQLRRDHCNSSPEEFRAAMENWVDANQEAFAALRESEAAEAEQIKQASQPAQGETDPRRTIKMETLPEDASSDLKRVAEIQQHQAEMLETLRAAEALTDPAEAGLAWRAAMESAFMAQVEELQNLQEKISSEAQNLAIQKTHEDAATRQ
ncbi:MAG: hypothetical protein ACR2OZ_18575 [Verrucomicrobiales bacterium]